MSRGKLKVSRVAMRNRVVLFMLVLIVLSQSSGCAVGREDTVQSPLANLGIWPPTFGHITEDAERDATTTVESYTESIPGLNVSFEMIAIPPGSLLEDGTTYDIDSLHISKTEITWDLYDIYVYQLDLEKEQAASRTGADAVTRPSKPYVPPDRGFGHDGYPAIGMTFHAATEFCKWLSEKTGKTYRLPTEIEWEYICRAGASEKSVYPFGNDAILLGDYAWFDDNADYTTHPVGKKQPNAWGVYDMLGNAAEWCIQGDGSDSSKGVTRGGHFLNVDDELEINDTLAQQPSWNASDPQIPKSNWWLADCTFVGFRVVCDDE